jgi:hypothetical protein
MLDFSFVLSLSSPVLNRLLLLFSDSSVSKLPPSSVALSAAVAVDGAAASAAA